MHEYLKKDILDAMAEQHENYLAVEQMILEIAALTDLLAQRKKELKTAREKLDLSIEKLARTRRQREDMIGVDFEE